LFVVFFVCFCLYLFVLFSYIVFVAIIVSLLFVANFRLSFCLLDFGVPLSSYLCCLLSSLFLVNSLSWFKRLGFSLGSAPVRLFFVSLLSSCLCFVCLFHVSSFYLWLFYLSLFYLSLLLCCLPVFWFVLSLFVSLFVSIENLCLLSLFRAISLLAVYSIFVYYLYCLRLCFAVLCIDLFFASFPLVGFPFIVAAL
jgi:hypothetical protein